MCNRLGVVDPILQFDVHQKQAESLHIFVMFYFKQFDQSKKLFHFEFDL